MLRKVNAQIGDMFRPRIVPERDPDGRYFGNYDSDIPPYDPAIARVKETELRREMLWTRPYLVEQGAEPGVNLRRYAGVEREDGKPERMGLWEALLLSGLTASEVAALSTYWDGDLHPAEAAAALGLSRQGFIKNHDRALRKFRPVLERLAANGNGPVAQSVQRAWSDEVAV